MGDDRPAATTREVAREQLVLLDIRLPRLLLGMFVGAALAVAGAMMQGMFRNPLADPGLIGVSSGAALAAVATIALGNGLAAPWIKAFGAYALPVAAFVGGIATTALLVGHRRPPGQLAIGTLLLAGIALAALNTALMGLIAFASDDRELRDLTLWTAGQPVRRELAQGVRRAAVRGRARSPSLPRLIRGLNGLLLGEAEAFHLGIDVERTKRVIVVVTSAAVGAAVAVAGIVGFVGIVVPHVVRLLAGPDHRIVLPASALIGATLVLVADIFARMLVRPAELPLGVVMAIIGAPDLPAHGGQARRGGGPDAMLQARDVTYTVNGHTLVDGVDMDVRPGRVDGADRAERRGQVDPAAHRWPAS